MPGGKMVSMLDVFHKSGSPQKSTPTGWSSPEDTFTAEDLYTFLVGFGVIRYGVGGFSTRRCMRGSGDDRDKTSSNLDSIEMMRGGDDILSKHGEVVAWCCQAYPALSSIQHLQDKDEAVRYICGFDDYPGPPPLGGDSKQGINDTIHEEGQPKPRNNCFWPGGVIDPSPQRQDQEHNRNRCSETGNRITQLV
ncbi:hypothetical protein CONLIGDRAFT_319139 [Coniochaeta ligniaria NRRL 30616]|uniref:Uncharacterized protein n=1 Tax=Coniochaeta ligniaria NRRL 30616 TaxID=1408157 RepID=A0A1J7IZB3_9PEZI|nr:hypothetical protein CONLIGDRAFT_319139 [Coniochaeta ligniaria NRRL 30616]